MSFKYAVSGSRLNSSSIFSILSNLPLTAFSETSFVSTSGIIWPVKVNSSLFALIDIWVQGNPRADAIAFAPSDLPEPGSPKRKMLFCFAAASRTVFLWWNWILWAAFSTHCGTTYQSGIVGTEAFSSDDIWSLRAYIQCNSLLLVDFGVALTLLFRLESPSTVNSPIVIVLVGE